MPGPGLTRRGGRVAAGLLLAALSLGAPAPAELADVHLKSGLVLRGDVTSTDGEVVVRNALGEVRFPLADVARIVPLRGTPAEPPASAPASAPSTAPGTSAPAGDSGADDELPPPPRISADDINRLRLGELTLDGAPEDVRFRFLRHAGQEDLTTEVLELLRMREDYEPGWERILTRGPPAAQLQLIIRTTGLSHADRVQLQSDPHAFALFRRRVLPLIERGCARSGCHAGTTARAFRFPIGTRESDAYVYTSFVLLDQMQTAHGPLIDRVIPEDSVLLSYMLPREGNPRPHPPVGRGPRFKPTIRPRSEEYQAVADWINFLLTPAPDYGLEYDHPYRGPFDLTEPSDTPAADESEPDAAPPDDDG